VESLLAVESMKSGKLAESVNPPNLVTYMQSASPLEFGKLVESVKTVESGKKAVESARLVESGRP
jgi:predicted HAD superfamily phosphohydrolase